MTLPPDGGQGSPGAPSSPVPPSGGGAGTSGGPSGPPSHAGVPPKHALARLLDRPATADGAHVEALLRSLVDASPLAMWVLDPDGCVIVWNQAAERLTGWRADEVLGQLSPIVPPDKIDEFRTLFAKVLRKEHLVDVEVSRRRKDGTPIDLSLSSAALVAPDGSVVAVLVMAADLTTRREVVESERRLASERAAREAADAARQRVEESESRFRSLAEATSQVVWTTDAKGRIAGLVPQWTALTGQPSSEAQGYGMLETIHPDDRPEVERLWREAIASTRPFTATFRQRVAAGGYRWFAARGVPVMNPDGSVREWVGASSDIHERKSAEAALRESEARFRTMAEEARESDRRHRRIFDTVEVSIWEEDFSAVREAIDKLKAEGVTDIRRYLADHPEFVTRAASLVRVRDVNDATLAIFGARDKSELLASLDRVFVPETVTVFADEIAAIFDGRTRLQSETPGRTLGGQPLQLAFSVAFPTDDPQLRSVLVSMLDITDRKRVEAEREQLLAAERAARERTERLQAVTAALVETVTVEDVAARVVETVAATTSARSVSLAFVTQDGAEFEVAKMVGLSEEMATKWHRYPADPGYVSTQVIRTGEPVFLRNTDELREHFPKIGDVAAASGFAASAVLPLVVGGKPIGTLGLNYATPQSFDAGKRAYLGTVAQQCAQALERARLFEAERAARAEAESARREADAARAVAEQASRAKSDFLATMSHELRTPLNAIIGYQNLLADGVSGTVTDSQRRQLDRIGASAHHLLMLIDEVLTLSRVEAGKETVRLEPVDVARVLDEANAIIEPLATQKNLEFRVIGPEATVVIQTDAGKLRQAILNLLSNAVKFTGRGSVTLRVLTEGEEVVFEVRDTGIGIASEHLDRIFEPFWQVEGSTTRTATGTGLGLAVTRRIAHMLGGQVLVQSAVGEGSVFSLRLPRDAGRGTRDAGRSSS